MMPNHPVEQGSTVQYVRAEIPQSSKSCNLFKQPTTDAGSTVLHGGALSVFTLGTAKSGMGQGLSLDNTLLLTKYSIK
jgi:hypothetical protein